MFFTIETFCNELRRKQARFLKLKCFAKFSDREIAIFDNLRSDFLNNTVLKLIEYLETGFNDWCKTTKSTAHTTKKTSRTYHMLSNLWHLFLAGPFDVRLKRSCYCQQTCCLLLNLVIQIHKISPYSTVDLFSQDLGP